MQTAEEITDKLKLFGVVSHMKHNISAAMKKHTSQALTAYRADILSAIERGEDISKLDLGKYNL